MLLAFRFSFATSKNYINQFKVRSRLADFFKHIHPDQMAQAPTKIKQQNLRSLKNFNSYLDAINQEKPIEGKLLKFYISEKTNNKSRKFFSFNLELPQLNAQQVQLDQKKAQKLIDDIVIALNTKYKQSRGILQGKKKDKIVLQPEVKIETQEERFSRLQETVGPFQSNFKRYIEEQSLKKAINAKFMQAQRQQLKLKLRKNMAFANTPTNKPMMWSRLLSEDSGIYSDYQEILNHLIDPKLIYFSQEITLHEIEVFKKKLLPGELDRLGVRATQAVLQVCEQMESFNPPICLYVTTHYSASQIPGFFSVPFDFRPAQMLQNFKKCKSIIINEREKYQALYDSYQESAKKLLTENRLKIILPPFKNNQDISSKLIALKRLQKLTAPSIIQIHFLENEDFRIFCQQYKLQESRSTHVYNGKIFTLTSFRDQELAQAVEGRNQFVI